MKPMTREWTEKAEGDHRVAASQWRVEDPVYDALCFHAQQCTDFPRMHDLVRGWLEGSVQ
jgi:HEPN domain-containing protein